MTAEWRIHLYALLNLLRLEGSAIERFNPSRDATRRALYLLWFILPLRVIAGVIGEYELITNMASYVPVRLVQTLAALLLPLPLIYLFCRMQKLEDRFPLFMTAYLWMSLFWATFSAVSNALTMHIAFDVPTIKAIGTTLFFIGYASISYVAWLALRCNPFVAVGVATIAFFCVSVTSDLSNLYMFNSARPLIGE